LAFEEDIMNTTTTPITATTEEVPYLQVFDRGGVKDLLASHQHVADYIGTITHTYNPMVYALPRPVTKPTTEEKAAFAKMLKKEKEIMGKIRRLIRGVERDCDKLLTELGFGPSSWETGWGNVAVGNENDDIGAYNNPVAN
jgi:hypothetical protein